MLGAMITASTSLRRLDEDLAGALRRRRVAGDSLPDELSDFGRLIRRQCRRRAVKANATANALDPRRDFRQRGPAVFGAEASAKVNRDTGRWRPRGQKARDAKVPYAALLGPRQQEIDLPALGARTADPLLELVGEEDVRRRHEAGGYA